MKCSVIALALFLGWASTGWPATPAPLSTLRAIRALTKAEASQALPVAFEATVTQYTRSYRYLFVQDGDQAIFVFAPKDANLSPGDRVLVRGTTQINYSALIFADSITVVGHGALPKPIPAGFDDLMRGKRDCILVSVRGMVRAADQVLRPDVRSEPSAARTAYLQVLTDGGYIDAMVDGSDPSALNSLLDSEVEITGAAGGEFDGKWHQTGVLLHVSSLADVKVLKRPSASPWSLPVTPMDDILAGYHIRDFTSRVRVRGTITYYQPGYYRPGAAIVLQNGTESLWIESQTAAPLRIGDLADATGFPNVVDGSLALAHAEIKDQLVQAPAAPLPVTWAQLADADMAGRHHYDLVSIEGQVVMETREASQDQYVLVSNGQLFSAIFHHPDATSQLSVPSMKQIPLGAKVRVTGICMLLDSNPFTGQAPFNILVRSFDDITVVAKPSWLNVGNLILLVGLLLAVVLAVGVRGWTLERKVRRQTASLAYIERRRGRILENINSSRPLAEILEEISELVSFRLRGSPCWCQIADGAQLGNCPATLSGLRIVRGEIPARSGPPLGTIFAAFDPLTKPAAIESETLSMAAALATLAIETRRLYSDLIRRSEFDLLTDIHNRFSLDKQLDALIEQARLNAGIFGLIYIDLDRFKTVNDQYGHHIGDLVLQEAAVRMKRQLRSHDMLARLGGDEFAVLVPLVHNRADVEEVALRLEHCFDAPYAVEEYVLHGSASVGVALYPQDGTTKDSLLSAADAAMYAAKHTKGQSGQLLATEPHP